MNAHDPIKDGTILGHYCFCVWMDKNYSKTQRVDADFLETDDDITNEERTYRSLSEVLNKLTFERCCQLPMSKSLFLLAFNFNRSLTNKSSMFPMHSHAHSTKGNALVLARYSWTKRNVHL